MDKYAVESGGCALSVLRQGFKPVQNRFLLPVVLSVAVMFLFLPPSAEAHNVIGGVYAIGSSIEGEVGFSNGDMAAEGTEITVSDAAGNVLGKVLTDAEGLFVFEASQRIEHHFFADLSSGHLLDLSLPAEELPDTLPGGDGVTGAAVDAEPQVNFDGDQKALQALVEQAVAKQVKPLRKELAAYKEKAGFQDILGGMGYIFGLCGLGIWWRQRQREKGDASVS